MEVESKGYMNGIQKNEMSECTLNLSLGWSKLIIFDLKNETLKNGAFSVVKTYGHKCS